MRSILKLFRFYHTHLYIQRSSGSNESFDDLYVSIGGCTMQGSPTSYVIFTVYRGSSIQDHLEYLGLSLFRSLSDRRPTVPIYIYRHLPNRDQSVIKILAVFQPCQYIDVNDDIYSISHTNGIYLGMIFFHKVDPVDDAHFKLGRWWRTIRIGYLSFWILPNSCHILSARRRNTKEGNMFSLSTTWGWGRERKPNLWSQVHSKLLVSCPFQGVTPWSSYWSHPNFVPVGVPQSGQDMGTLCPLDRTGGTPNRTRVPSPQTGSGVPMDRTGGSSPQQESE